MSNPVTNVEVEDVLSSIRRLVSDDNRPSMTANPAPSNDRLVLTPALRVAETVDENTDVNGSDHDDVEEPAIQAWSEFGAGPVDLTDHADTDLDDNGDLGDVSEEAPFEQNAEPDESWDMDDHDDGGRDSNENAISDRDDSENDDQDSSEDVAKEPFVLVSSEEAKEEVSEAVEASTAPVSDIPDAEFVDQSEQAAFFAIGATTLTAKIAALETVIGKTDDQWEPDDTGDSDYSGTEAPAMDWDDTEAPVSSADLEVETPVAGDEDPQTVDDILDEEAMRDLVSDIVREELQGALGERITRNVRKLVRREIHRALAAQELE